MLLEKKIPPAYQTIFHMPIIADTEFPYKSVKNSTTVTAQKVGAYALNISVSNPNYGQLYTMAGAFVSFVPAGGFDPFQLHVFYPSLPNLVPGTGALIQQIVPDDVLEFGRVLPEGVPSPKFIVYLNVDPASVRNALDLTVRLLPEEILKQAWKLPGGSLEEYVDNYHKKILGGEISVFLWGGVPIGRPASSDFVLFFSGGPPEGVNGISPIPQLRSLPDFAGDTWEGHPLIDAVSDLSVPVDIYASFAAWDRDARKYSPLPDGVGIDLMDFDSLSSNDVLASLSTEAGLGVVHFKFSDIQNIDEKEPDLFFLAHLGSLNPEEGLLPDDWSSREWIFLGLLSTGSGYYPNFIGTRLGKEAEPLIFRIGLGFWAELISLRPPVEVQSALKQVSRSVHHIEDAGGDPDRNPDINLDFYPVRVRSMPTVNGKHFTAPDLLRYIRLNLNEFVDTSLFDFSLDDEEADGEKWETVDPADPVALRGLLGVVLHLDFYLLWIVNVDDGSVVVSDIDTTQFTVSTIFTLGDFGHPVSGNRCFGFTIEPDGSWIFFTKGADRPTGPDDDDLSGFEFRGANLSWLSFQNGIAEFVNKNGGQASLDPAFSGRFPWNYVKDKYWKPTVNWI